VVQQEAGYRPAEQSHQCDFHIGTCTSNPPVPGAPACAAAFLARFCSFKQCSCFYLHWIRWFTKFQRKKQRFGCAMNILPIFFYLKPGVGRNSGPTGPPRIPGTPGTPSWNFVGPAISVSGHPAYCKPSPRPSPPVGMLFLAFMGAFLMFYK